MPSLNFRDKLLESLNPPAEHQTWCKGAYYNHYFRQLEQAEEMQAEEMLRCDLTPRIRKNKRTSSMLKSKKQVNSQSNKNLNLNTSKSVESDARGQDIEQKAGHQTLLAHKKPTRNQCFGGKSHADCTDQKEKSTYTLSTKACQLHPQPTVCDLLQHSYNKLKHDNASAFVFPPLLTPFKRSFFHYFDEKTRPITHTSYQANPMYRNFSEARPIRDTLQQRNNVFSCAERKIIDEPFQGQVNGPPAFISSWATRMDHSF
ncbi:unnamed protein product [Phytomonas sp. EM1]|nr:unnamed protein product [Phytomonas sp. EM1]|eukprot:CCW61724.1 unnamed protein product [Phytomonas sp. isolate EM1]